MGDISALYPTLQNIILCCTCIPHHGRLFCVVSHTAEWFSVLYSTPQKNILRCFQHFGILFCVVSHTVEDYYALYPTLQNIILCCIPHRGRLLCIVSHTAEYYSVFYPTTKEDYSALYPTLRNIIPCCIPHHGRLFRDPTPQKIILHCIPQRIKLLFRKNDDVVFKLFGYISWLRVKRICKIPRN